MSLFQYKLHQELHQNTKDTSDALTPLNPLLCAMISQNCISGKTKNKSRLGMILAGFYIISHTTAHGYSDAVNYLFCDKILVKFFPGFSHFCVIVSVNAVSQKSVNRLHYDLRILIKLNYASIVFL